MAYYLYISIIFITNDEINYRDRLQTHLHSPLTKMDAKGVRLTFDKQLISMCNNQSQDEEELRLIFNK